MHLNETVLRQIYGVKGCPYWTYSKLAGIAEQTHNLCIKVVTLQVFETVR